MPARNDSPVISTFAHARKISTASSTLNSIPELPQPRVLHHSQTYVYSPTVRSPKPPKWNRYNTFFYSPSVASQRVFSTSTASTPTVENCPSILSLPLLGAESDDESDGEDWNQGWDIMSVDELPWNSCKLPLIRDGEFEYYPRGECAQVVSRWSEESESDFAESVGEVEEIVVKKVAKEKTGFRMWCRKVLRKMKLRIRK